MTGKHHMEESARPAARLSSRREFTLEAALALLGTVLITVSESCGGGSSPTSPSPSPSPSSTDIVGVISANHGHSAVITNAQVTAGNAFVLNIQGSATHPHTVNMTQGDLMTLQARQQVAKESSTNDGHSHTVTFTP